MVSLMYTTFLAGVIKVTFVTYPAGVDHVPLSKGPSVTQTVIGILEGYIV
jgi:hypothetical protein